MVLSHSVIRIKDKPLFERVVFQTPYAYESSLTDLACFFYIREGHYQVVEPAGPTTLRSQEALVKNCGQYISRYVTTTNHDRCEAIAIYFYPDVIREVYQHEAPFFLKEPRTTPKKVVTSELIDKYVLNLLIYFEHPELIDEALAILKFKELVLLLLKTEQAQSVQELFSDLFYPHQLSLKATVEHNLYTPLTIRELAFLCNMSLSSFKRAFKALYHDTPARYIKHRRLSQAATLLKATPHRITDVAYDCGFQDITTFSSAFQQKFGVSPRQYRLSQTINSLD